MRTKVWLCLLWLPLLGAAVFAWTESRPARHVPTRVSGPQEDATESFSNLGASAIVEQPRRLTGVTNFPAPSFDAPEPLVEPAPTMAQLLAATWYEWSLVQSLDAISDLWQISNIVESTGALPTEPAPAGDEAPEGGAPLTKTAATLEVLFRDGRRPFRVGDRLTGTRLWIREISNGAEVKTAGGAQPFRGVVLQSDKGNLFYLSAD